MHEGIRESVVAELLHLWKCFGRVVELINAKLPAFSGIVVKD